MLHTAPSRRALIRAEGIARPRGCYEAAGRVTTLTGKPREANAAVLCLSGGPKKHPRENHERQRLVSAHPTSHRPRHRIPRGWTAKTRGASLSPRRGVCKGNGAGWLERMPTAA